MPDKINRMCIELIHILDSVLKYLLRLSLYFDCKTEIQSFILTSGVLRSVEFAFQREDNYIFNYSALKFLLFFFIAIVLLMFTNLKKTLQRPFFVAFMSCVLWENKEAEKISMNSTH